MDGGMMGGMGHGECAPDHHMGVNGPMCDEYGRGRNVSGLDKPHYFTAIYYEYWIFSIPKF